jgi:hypothetical protein
LGERAVELGRSSPQRPHITRNADNLGLHRNRSGHKFNNTARTSTQYRHSSAQRRREVDVDGADAAVAIEFSRK